MGSAEVGNRLRAKYKEESVQKGILVGLNRAMDALFTYEPHEMEGFLKRELDLERQKTDRVTREIVGLKAKMLGLKGRGL